MGKKRAPAERKVTEKKTSRWGNGRLWVVLLVAAGVASVSATVAYLRFYPRYTMPSGSMIPTIDVGQRFVVRSLDAPPARGDVIVFRFPEHPDTEFAKRVIAVGGDTLSVKAGHPTINGWEVPNCKVGAYEYLDADEPGSGMRHKGDLYVEFLGASAYLTFYQEDGVLADAQGPYRAKGNEYWVMGDNRHNSHDSRMWYGGAGGGVPLELVRGGVPQPSVPLLPSGAAALQPALDACMRSRPPLDKTTPPSSAR